MRHGAVRIEAGNRREAGREVLVAPRPRLRDPLVDRQLGDPFAPGHGLLGEFRDGDWIVELDKVAPVAEWASELTRTWLVVPLNHRGSLIGFVVLARSRAQFKLDREVFDLLRIIGREVASRVAEQLAAQVLSQTQQLREYSQRFAFVIHDIKNVSGQLSMLLTNAEIHADNPEFQRDMLATVRASVAKITRLLTRLQADRQERSRALIQPLQRLRDVVQATRRTARTVVELSDDSGGAGVMSRTDHGHITATDWFLIGGGESGWIVVDPDDPNILYATGAYGGVVRYDRRTSLSQDISPWPMQNFGTEINGRKYRAPWTPMLVVSPIEKGTLFLGTQYVMKQKRQEASSKQFGKGAAPVHDDQVVGVHCV